MQTDMYESNSPPDTHRDVPKKLNILLPMLLALALTGGMLIGTKMQNNPPTVATIRQAKPSDLLPGTMGPGKLEELIRYIDSRYVDDVNKDELVKEAIDNILFQLDPHSSYISAEELKEVNEQLDGSFEGIGIEFIVVDDTVVVVAALSGGPAADAGILSGDKIVQIEDSLCVGANINYEGILDRLKGEKGSKIKIGIRRGFEDDVRFFTVTREKIPVNSVEAAYMLDKEAGYVKLSRFSANTYEEFMEALEHLVDSLGMKHLVLDLRQNPGGYLQEATGILNQIIKENEQMLVYTLGNNSPRNEYKSTGRNRFDLGNVAILVDEGSASASEIIAGAIQDSDRGAIVGRRTFGKGLVQEQYNLRDGSAIRLTVARYYTPSGRCIQRPYGGDTSYDENMAERMESGELYDGKMIEFEDTTRFFTEGGRVVFGGGGIAPDFFVPMDSSLVNPYFIRLRKHLSAYVFRLIENKNANLAPKNLPEFSKNHVVTDEQLNRFLEFAIKQGEKRNERSWKLVKNDVRIALKATLARHFFGEKGYQFVVNEQDAAVKKALRLVKQDDPISMKAK